MGSISSNDFPVVMLECFQPIISNAKVMKERRFVKHVIHTTRA